jgi:uncharacterized membrane protein YgdD (TMEM256/DUF423 family)
MNHRVTLLAGALLGLTGVAFGAFGAHALRPFLMQNGMLEVWQTAVQYQLIHAVALLGWAGWLRVGAASAPAGRTPLFAGWLWVAGTALFSGSLYCLALGGPRWLGPITPLGGVSLLAGWLLVVLAAFRSP